MVQRSYRVSQTAFEVSLEVSPNLDKPELNKFQTTKYTKYTKFFFLCAPCVNGHCLPILRFVVKFLFFVPGLDC